MGSYATRTVLDPVPVGTGIPVRVQQADFGTDNPSAFTPGYNTRPVARPSLADPGPSQAKEQFVASEDGLDAPTARQLNNLQSDIQRATAQAKANPFSNGMLMEGVSFINGSTVVQHNLGLPARGFIITNASASANTWRDSFSDTNRENNEIAIRADAAFTGSVWIYA